MNTSHLRLIRSVYSYIIRNFTKSKAPIIWHIKKWTIHHSSSVQKTRTKSCCSSLYVSVLFFHTFLDETFSSQRRFYLRVTWSETKDRIFVSSLIWGKQSVGNTLMGGERGEWIGNVAKAISVIRPSCQEDWTLSLAPPAWHTIKIEADKPLCQRFQTHSWQRSGCGNHFPLLKSLNGFVTTVLFVLTDSAVERHSAFPGSRCLQLGEKFERNFCNLQTRVDTRQEIRASKEMWSFWIFFFRNNGAQQISVNWLF